MKTTSNKKLVFPVTVEKVKRIKGDIIILNGGRNSGKSYAVKTKVLQDAYNNIVNGDCKKKFVYLRRYVDETKDVYCATYFDDIDISLLTGGVYNNVSVYRHEIYFGNLTEDGKITREMLIGRVLALSKYITYKSQVFKNYFTIIFEEFISETYLSDEPNKLLNMFSTILRYNKGCVYMIGNLISRFNPYYRDFELTNALSQKNDTIDYYNINDVTIALWRCPSTDSNNMIFGHAKKAIDGITYVTTPQPHLPCEREECERIYTVVLVYRDFKYLMEFLRYKDNCFWYVSPKTTEIQKGTRVISDTFSADLLTTCGFVALNNNESIIFDYIRKNKICFSDNLTGTEFKQFFSMF